MTESEEKRKLAIEKARKKQQKKRELESVRNLARKLELKAEKMLRDE